MSKETKRFNQFILGDMSMMVRKGPCLEDVEGQHCVGSRGPLPLEMGECAEGDLVEAINIIKGMYLGVTE